MARILALAVMLAAAGVLLVAAPCFAQPGAGNGPARVVFLYSYHEGFWVTLDEEQGLVQGLARAGFAEGQNLEILRLFMDTKTVNKSTEAMESVALEVLRSIADFGPDVVVMLDDDALQHVGAKLLDSGTPVVFAGVNFLVTDPDYGWLDQEQRTALADSLERPGHNVTGVMECVPFRSGVSLLKHILPQAETALFISDDSYVGNQLMAAGGAREALEGSELTFVDWVFTDNFAEFQRTVLDYQDKVDCILLFIPWTLEDEQGVPVNQRDVVRWMLMNNRRPGVAYLDVLAEEGILCGVVVDMVQQGFHAGTMAGRILSGEDPAAMPIANPIAQRVMLNLARAEQLGIDIPFEVLKTADVVFHTMSAWPEYSAGDQ